MIYTHTVEFELKCKLDLVYSYCDYYANDIDDVKNDPECYLGEYDGAEILMDLGGWVFVNGDPFRWVSLYIEDRNQFTLETMLERLDKHLTFVVIICDYDDSRLYDYCNVNEADEELQEYIKKEFKRNLVELFL